MSDPDATAVADARRAAERVVAAFAAHDTAAYFAGFATDATFLFHNHPRLLVGREAYRALWLTWEAEGFHVEGCTSDEARCDLVASDVAVFTHRVRTVLRGEGEQRERETIVLARRDGRWTAVHEHLSPDVPGDPGDPGPA